MRMPEMDGAEFLGKVAAKWPWVIRVLLTGHSDISATVDAINKGKIYRYISKPWEEAALKLTVQGALEQRFLEQERRRLVLFFFVLFVVLFVFFVCFVVLFSLCSLVLS